MIAQTSPYTETLADPQALAVRVADWLLRSASAKPDHFALCLSGGSTPKVLYSLMATAPYADAFPWDRMHFFLGDERFVRPDDPRSNLRMIREALFDHVPVPASNIHAVETDGVEASVAARDYERTLKAFYGAEVLEPGRPLFDVVLLGLGPDGHTASLFPGTGVLTERMRWAAEVIGPKTEMRITLTYPVLESTSAAAFLVAGDEKRAILRRYQSGDLDLPATRYRPQGELRLFLDVAAGAGRMQKLPQS